MKKQNAKNKLAFNKETVYQLNNESMISIVGGTGYGFNLELEPTDPIIIPKKD